MYTELIMVIKPIYTAIFLAIVNTKVIDYFTTPIKKKYPLVDFWWLLYIALVTGSVISWFAEVNLFASIIPNILMGRILTGILVGGGSSLIYDIFDEE